MCCIGFLGQNCKIHVPLRHFKAIACPKVQAVTLPTKIQKELRSLNINPKRSLGQNFVTSEDVLRQIVTYSNVREGDKVLEIGPGLGSLTEQLIDRGAAVLAIEKDDVLFQHLEQKFAQVFPTAIIGTEY